MSGGMGMITTAPEQRQTGIVYLDDALGKVPGTHVLAIGVGTYRDKGIAKDHLARRAFSLSQEIAAMRSKAAVSLMFVDACRDNPLAPVSEGGGRTRSVSGGAGQQDLARIGPLNGAFIAFATDPGSFADDGMSGGNSPFTAALLQFIAEPGLSINAMMLEVKRAVRDATNRTQVPWDQSSLTEEFYFVPPPVITSLPVVRLTEEEQWALIANEDEPRVFEDFLANAPDSPHASEARKRLAELRAPRAIPELPQKLEDGQQTFISRPFSKDTMDTLGSLFDQAKPFINAANARLIINAMNRMVQDQSVVNLTPSDLDSLLLALSKRLPAQWNDPNSALEKQSISKAMADLQSRIDAGTISLGDDSARCFTTVKKNIDSGP